MTKIQEIIEKLPDLSETVFKLQKMREQPDTEIVQVLDILEENRFIVAKIMKIANSKLFRFANRIDTLNKESNQVWILVFLLTLVNYMN